MPGDIHSILPFKNLFPHPRKIQGSLCITKVLKHFSWVVFPFIGSVRTWKSTEANTSGRICVRCAQRSLRVVIGSCRPVDGKLSSLSVLLGLPKTGKWESKKGPSRRAFPTQASQPSVPTEASIWMPLILLGRMGLEGGAHLLTASWLSKVGILMGELRTEKPTGANGEQRGTDRGLGGGGWDQRCRGLGGKLEWARSWQRMHV